MRAFFTAVLLLFTFSANCQTHTTFRDTVNKFSIELPAGWKYKIPATPPTIKLVAFADVEASQKVRDNFNVNVLEEAGSNLAAVTAKLLEYISAAEGYKLLDSGRLHNNAQPIFWMDETHVVKQNNTTVFSTVFVIYDTDKVYIYTATGDKDRISTAKPFFHRIGSTLKTGLAIRRETLKMVVPGLSSWKILFEGEDSVNYIKQLIPANETKENWQTTINQTFVKGIKVEKIHQVVDIFVTASKSETNLTKTTIINEVEGPGQKWALFKAETPYYPNDPRPESQLYYLLQGKDGVHVAFVAIREKQLSPEFVKKWTEIFRKSSLVYE
ncbi:hypothetical protein [Chitinophaga sancti]|uniref:DUF1795 domain-containing protein n=1 Tax=Chitinophaga sancti TaxID=1004 RepID=A0A1K1R3K1_9BACT|nr:hypothetical protein [Chitinophaga sancti]WQD64293.1 hypothetical protein U0033_07790 [Chitinophaga sancti]WQG90083.1 hypothetical protein SR876_01130 [Chitinophaga sancti]SFW66696.1 hypothetical protein SAMN05661012_03350 [Chitinophaga sancti]